MKKMPEKINGMSYGGLINSIEIEAVYSMKR